MEALSLEAISTVGFPIAMCIYLMFKFEKTLEENTKALQSLKDCIRARVVPK